MIAAAASAIPGASCAVGNRIFYGSNNLLISWSTDNDDLLLEGSVDSDIKAVCVHQKESLLIGTENGSIYLYKNKSMALLHKFDRAVTCITSDPVSGNWATGVMDGKVYLHVLGPSEAIQEFAFKGYALCIALCGPLLVAGGTANQISVYDTTSKEVISLVGHESWVRSLSFKQIDENTHVLASASQERYIRLWHFSEGPEKAGDEFSSSQKIGKWAIAFEALLMGHDDWVLSVAWDPYGSGSLLSASADSSLIIWECEADELWTPSQRLGDLSTWGGSTATGTSGGFWTGLWLPNMVATVTRTGSWRVWLRDNWKPAVAPTGHFKDVTDIAWFNNQFILTTSLDQTTRLWFVGDAKHEEANRNKPLKEIGRPQIHGYDMIAVAPVNDHMFVSAGDEKVMRVFELPRQVADQMNELSGGAQVESSQSLPQLAGMPALGLSNKPESEETVESLPAYPREDHLQRLTLWPEVDKLYGHGYEISSLDVSQPLNTVVSCCKANSDQHAKIRFYSAEIWQEVGLPAAGHSLTVTSLNVSPNGKHVLSVSRDRKLMVVDIATHEVILDVPKAHTRIVWDGCWCNDSEFITVSRDKTIKKWNVDGTVIGSVKLENPVTAVDYANGTIVAGDETGELFVLNNDLEIQKTVKLAGRVNRIALNSPLAAVATSLLVSVIEVTK